jgi:methylated-DNA-[protein]-cysteine S-methyltransferase
MPRRFEKREKEKEMNLTQWKMDCMIGSVFLVASDKGLRGIYWKKQEPPCVWSLEGNTPELRLLRQAVSELEEYFGGKRKAFGVKLDLIGTPFQMRVWKQLCLIPFGQTLSYRDVADRIQNAKAFRAVGTANGRNPVSIIVPCHRVIAADGTMGGYAGGLKIKSQLLELERG